MPPSCHVMALTATATKSSRMKILQSLCMVRATTISLSPHKKNIVYAVYPKSMLGTEFSDPPGAPSLVKYRLLDMYTKCTGASVKEDIVTEFSKPSGRLRFVIATIAFGMGAGLPRC